MLTNTVKEHFSDKKVAVIVNEFGDIGIDGNIISNVHSEVLEISEGCICCQLAQEFEAGVIEIIQKYQPELIFVETSGASEPFPIFMSLQNLGISVEGVICVTDVKNFDSYKENSTAKYQIGGSNIIVLNKVDLVTEEELQTVKDEIITIKETYDIKNNLTGEKVFKGYLLQEAEQGIVKKEVFNGIYKVDEIIEMAKTDLHHKHTSADAITQKIAYVKEEVAFGEIDQLLQSLPENIYRVKGVVKTKDIPGSLLINYAFGDASFEELQTYDEKPILIFIGESVEEAVNQLNQAYHFLIVPQFRVA